jgi:hypothetical protein
MRSPSRILVALLAVSTMVPALPAIAAVNSFIDDDSTKFEPHIETAREQGFLTPCNPPENNLVCPSDAMTRGNMVLMLARAIGLEPPTEEPFVTGKGFLGDFAIGALAGAGIETGCTTGRPCPDAPISRGEMASLFSRAFRWEGGVDTGAYVDISNSHFWADLVELASRGGLLACDSPVDRHLCPNAVVRRDEAAFALVTVMGLEPAVVDRSPDPTPIGFGDSFDELSLWDGRAPGSRNRVRLTDSGYRGSALRVSIPRGSHYGADFHLHLQDAATAEPDRLYFRYYLKLDSDWSTEKSGKLPGFSGVYGSSGKGGYQSSPGNPGWSARLMFSPGRGDDPRVSLGYYVYHLGQETQYGEGVGWNEAGRLRPGEWYCLEGQVEMNTPGLADGSLQAWVDGTPALDFSGLEFRRPNEPEIKIESFWFNVYYGGKQVPTRDLGLTIDEVVVDTHRVGCAAGSGVAEQAPGDFNGDGYEDAISWNSCPRGACLVLETSSPTGSRTIRELRDTAWFSLETHQLGAVAGDVDGDGKDEIVYRGRCDASAPCWRVHSELTDQTTAGENWGDGARFSVHTGKPTIGDWDGDGLEDLAYQGMCGSGDDSHDCWRVHRSTGSAFEEPVDWGVTPQGIVAAAPVDLSGDGRADLLYQSACDQSVCWFGQMSSGSAFSAPIDLGPVTPAERNQVLPFDFDGNGTIDLVSWSADDESSGIEIRYGSADRLGPSVNLARLETPIHDLHLERPGGAGPVLASIRVGCDSEDPCMEYLFGSSGRELTDAEDFRRIAHGRLGLPAIS